MVVPSCWATVVLSEIVLRHYSAVGDSVGHWDTVMLGLATRLAYLGLWYELFELVWEDICVYEFILCVCVSSLCVCVCVCMCVFACTSSFCLRMCVCLCVHMCECVCVYQCFLRECVPEVIVCMCVCVCVCM